MYGSPFLLLHGPLRSFCIIVAYYFIFRLTNEVFYVFFYTDSNNESFSFSIQLFLNRGQLLLNHSKKEPGSFRNKK